MGADGFKRKITAIKIPDAVGYRTVKILSFSSSMTASYAISVRRASVYVTPWCDFLQIPPHGGHPCRPANTSPLSGV